MVTLNDYLYSGSTIFRILNNYIRDLRKDAKVNHNEIDLVHSNFLIHIQEISICGSAERQTELFPGFYCLSYCHFITEMLFRFRGRQEKTGIRVSLSDCQYSAGVSGRTRIYCGACRGNHGEHFNAFKRRGSSVLSGLYFS